MLDLFAGPEDDLRGRAEGPDDAHDILRVVVDLAHPWIGLPRLGDVAGGRGEGGRGQRRASRGGEQLAHHWEISGSAR